MSVIPTLMQLLHTEYRLHWEEQIKKTPGRVPQHLSTVPDFLAFAEDYLARNPAVEVFYPGEGIGVRLTNTRMAMIHGRSSTTPAAASPMQASDSVAITGDTLRQSDDIGGVAITGGQGFGKLP